MYFFTPFLFVLSVLVSFNAQAIVSMQTLHLEEPVPGWKAGLNLGLNGALGNTENFRVSGGGLLLNYHNNVIHYLSFNSTYGESFGVEDQNKSFVHVRRIQQISERWAGELFGQAENNKFSRLNLRVLGGAGGRYKVLSDRNNKLFAGLGAFYSVEDIDDSATDNEGGKHTNVKGNAYLVYQRNFLFNAIFVSTTYLQPQLDKLNDIRLLENAALKFKLNDSTNLKFSLDVVFDSEPPPSVKKLDVNYSTSIEMRF